MLGRRAKANGWYRDPYRRHGARFFSDGIPTELVRDGRSESFDPVPDVPVLVRLTRVKDRAVSRGGLRRADDYERGSAFDPASTGAAATNAVVSYGSAG